MFAKLFSIGALVAMLSTGIAFTGTPTGKPKAQDACCVCCTDCELCALLCGECCWDCCDLKDCQGCCDAAGCCTENCSGTKAKQPVSSPKKSNCCASTPAAVAVAASKPDAGKCCVGGSRCATDKK